MTELKNNWLTPEDALTRFKKPEKIMLNKQESDYKNKVNRYGFVIDNMGFLISENTLSEVVKNKNICPLPNTKNWMKGLINIRGNLVPVYDFSILLGLTKKDDQYNNLLVLDRGSHSIGILIEGLPRPCNVESWNKMSELPGQFSGLKKHVTNVYSSNEIVWIDFNQKSYFKSIKNKMIM